MGFPRRLNWGRNESVFNRSEFFNGLLDPNSVRRTIDTPEVWAKLVEWEEKVASFNAQQDLEQRIAKHHSWVESMTKLGKKIPAD